MMQYEYRVRVLPIRSGPLRGRDTVAVDFEALERMLNEQGKEEFELVSMSVKDRLVFFQRDVYVERLSDEHVDKVVKAAKSVEPIIMDLEFVISQGGTGSGGVLSGIQAWRYITKRILGEA